MLAGLPKAPSAYNPISNPKRARIRQLYIIDRMEDNHFISPQQAAEARTEELKIRTGPDNTRVHAEYVAEMARQLIFAQYGAEAYTRGLNVYTTLSASDQEAAYRSLRRGIVLRGVAARTDIYRRCAHLQCTHGHGTSPRCMIAAWLLSNWPKRLQFNEPNAGSWH